MDTSLAAVTVKVWAGLVIPPAAAVISAVPAAIDVANPDAAMVAALWLLDVQVAVEVRYSVLPSV